MEEVVRQRLLAINRHFYETFGPSFSGTRFGAQPGWERIIHYFPAQGAVLDLGCGNGRLALFLERHLSPAANLRYVGLEGSATLLAIARKKTAVLEHVRSECLQVDLSTDVWQRASGFFDVVTAMAVLHHIPGFAARARIMRAASACLRPGGVLILSNWRFAHNQRMQRKMLPWSAAGLSAHEVEAGDYLLDWKKDGRGMRYVHQLNQAEIEALAADAGLKVVEQFVADGREGDLSLYSVLRVQEAAQA